MSTSSTVTLSDLVDEVAEYLHSASEWPFRVTVGANALTSLATDTTLTLASQAEWDVVNPTSVLEFGSELLLVTAKSSDATPVFTVARGYLSTTPAVHATGDEGWLSPLYPRHQLLRALRYGFRALNGLVPYVTSELKTLSQASADADRYYISLGSASVMEVLGVDHIDPDDAIPTPIAGWEHDRYMPSGQVTGTTQVVWMPYTFKGDADEDSYRVVYRSHWPTVGTDETDEVTVPLGMEDLPVLYAAARMATGRELSRHEVDKVDEWNKEAAIRGGVNLRLLQSLWGDFYRRVDEVRKTVYQPKRRPYRATPRLVPNRSRYVY